MSEPATDNARSRRPQVATRAVELLGYGDTRRVVLSLDGAAGAVHDAVTAAGHEAVPVSGDATAQKVGGTGPDDASVQPGSCDGAVSVVALQSLLVADGADLKKALAPFFRSLLAALRPSGMAVLHFFPQSPSQTQTVAQAAAHAGFGGGIVVDYPHSARARRMYLVLSAGAGGSAPPMPLMDSSDDEAPDGDESDDGAASTIEERLGSLHV